MLHLHNTLTRSKEAFHPLKAGSVGLYTCGPTVYDYAHIGNFRTFAFQDLLKRYLQYSGYTVRHVMNITDVDDRIIQNARERGVGIHEYTRHYAQAFFEDLNTLGIQKAEVFCYATDHIPEMVALIRRLEEKGMAYRQEESVYFNVSQFASYGRLAHIDFAGIKPGARVDTDKYLKEDARDFALWKAPREGEDFWETEIGPGRPGWHIECSAMALKYLGETFDIHSGGVDLVFPHHENEIAQSEGATGVTFCRYWVHGEHLLVNNETMSKSKGNFYTLRDLVSQGFDPAAIRYLLVSVHYRKTFNFSFEGIQQSATALRRIHDLIDRLAEVSAPAAESSSLVSEALDKARQGFENAMDDDLNASEALAAIFDMVREINSLLDQGRVGAEQARAVEAFLHQTDSVFGTFFMRSELILEEEVERLIAERRQARLDRQFRRADEIREQLAQRGIVLEDTREGTRWKRSLAGPA
jgi:cysteinyl-tRNA synthetase